MAERLAVYRTTGGTAGRGFQLVGTLDSGGGFAYDPAFLCGPDAAPISQSLPLREEAFSAVEARPYFEGLLPEGAARTAIAAELHVREDDYLAILAGYGFDCIGDIAVAQSEKTLDPRYEPLSNQGLRELFRDAPSIARGSAVSRLSLGGTQHKSGLAHVPGAPVEEGWLRPLDGAASTHILKVSDRENVLFLEYLCTRAAHGCGVAAAHVDLLDAGRPVICSERYDRRANGADGELHVERLHQEDCTQAFGLLAGSKYAELVPSTAACVADFLRSHARRPVASLDAFVRLTCYNYLIGNCDNHLKNMALLYGPKWDGFDFAPAYDLVCTTWFPDLSRDMGMRLGSAVCIDEVGPADFAGFARETRYPLGRLRNVCHEMAARVAAAVGEAVAGAPRDFDELAWKAEDLLDDLGSRRRVLELV